MELEHNFYGVNFAPFPRRGVLNSETAHRSMAAMVEATAANWVILSPSGIQSDPYSEEIDWRTDATPQTRSCAVLSALPSSWACRWR